MRGILAAIGVAVLLVLQDIVYYAVIPVLPGWTGHAYLDLEGFMLALFLYALVAALNLVELTAQLLGWRVRSAPPTGDRDTSGS